MCFFYDKIIIGENMKENLRKIDIPLLLVSAILIVIGLVMIFSSSSIAAVLQYNRTEYYFFRKQLLVILGSILIGTIILFIPIKKYKILSLFMVVGVFIALFALQTYGTVTNSAKSWFRIGPMSLQPSEFAKTIIILFLAFAYGDRKRFKNPYNVFIPLIPCIAIFTMIVLEPDLGTAAIIAIICMFIFFSLPINKNSFMMILRAITVIGVLLVFYILQTNQEYLTDTQANRFTYKNPCERYEQETGYQVCNGYIAMHNGGLKGVGLGKSTQKYLYLPEAYTDFIFPIIIEEIGLVGGGAILILYLILLYRILVIARNASNLVGSIIAFGTFAQILTHITVNLGGALALIPLTGVPLPFLSYGGSYILNLIVLLSLTQRVAIESKSERASKRKS